MTYVVVKLLLSYSKLLLPIGFEVKSPFKDKLCRLLFEFDVLLLKLGAPPRRSLLPELMGKRRQQMSAAVSLEQSYLSMFKLVT